MDDSDIDDALRDTSELKDFDYSGSEYLPSEADGSDSEDGLSGIGEDDPIDNEYHEHEVRIVESFSDKVLDANQPNVILNLPNQPNVANQLNLAAN